MELQWIWVFRQLQWLKANPIPSVSNISARKRYSHSSTPTVYQSRRKWKHRLVFMLIPDLYISGQSGLAHVIPWSSHCCCICLSLIVFSPSSFFPGWRVCCALVPGTLALDCIDHWYWPFHKPLHKPLYQPLTSDSPTSIHSRFLFLHSVWSHYSCCSVTKAFVPGTRYLSRMKNQDAHRVYRWWWRSVERTV